MLDKASSIVLEDDLTIEAPIILNPYDLNIMVQKNIYPHLLHIKAQQIAYVNEETDKGIQHIVEKISHYFKIEYNSNLLPHIEQCKDKHHAYVFIEPASEYMHVDQESKILYEEKGIFSVRAIGACCFLYDKNNELILEWMWIHPYRREDKRILEKHFTYLIEEYNDFGLSEVLLDIMKTFFNTGGHNWKYNHETKKVEKN